MRRNILAVGAAIMVISMGVGSAWGGGNSLKAGTVGLNVDVNNDFMLTGKVLVAKDLAVLAGLGLGVTGGDRSGTDIGVMVGARKYIKADDFAPFVGGSIFYDTTQKGNNKNLDVLGELGAEYFLHKQFSIEGRVGFGYLSQENTVGNTTTRVNTTGTKRSGISFNYYFF